MGRPRHGFGLLLWRGLWRRRLGSCRLWRGLSRAGVYRAQAGWGALLTRILFANAVMAALLIWLGGDLAGWLSESPLHRAGFPIDAAVLARNDDAVLVPEGYHPVASAPGYTAYYLNVLAGSAQSLANSEDPRYAWVRSSYSSLDARVPIYDVAQAKR